MRGLPLDRRCDIFAIGTILYELLTAERLFMGESDFETLEKVRNVDVPPVTSINKNVPPELERIIIKALAHDVDERYQWANEMQEALHAFLLTREPVFTAKQLSTWMREQFALEMKREQQILDEQRKIGKEVLVGKSPAAPRGRNGATDSGGDDFGGATNVLEGAELADMVLAAEMSNDALLDDDGAEKTTVQPGFATVAAAPLPDQSTQILADALIAKTSSAPKTAGAAGETQVHGGAAPNELPAQPTVILEGGTGSHALPAAGGVLYSNPHAPTVSAMPAVPAPTSGPLALGPSASVILAETSPPYGSTSQRSPAISGVRSPSTGSVLAPPPYAHGARSTLWKDIAIGVGVAVAVVAGVLGARAIWSHGSKGTLVVMVNAARAADVFVDGALKGHIDPGAPLTLRELPAGAHQVVVKTGDGAEFKQQVALVANDVSVLTAAPRAREAAGPGTGHLKLNIATQGAQVYVDGAELADGAWRDPIPLRADVPHEIRVTKPLREEVKLQVTLRAGEAVMRDVELLPAYGKIVVASDPAGAEVSVNGKHSGVTPLTVGDVDPGKPARVTVRLKGYQSVTKYVAFEKGLEQALELKLVDESLVAQRGKGKDDDFATVKVASSGKGVPSSSSESGYLVANTQPWAKVIIDDRDTGKTTPIAPRSKIALKPGKHVVTFVANGKRFKFDVLIKPGEDTRLIKQLADSSP